MSPHVEPPSRHLTRSIFVSMPARQQLIDYVGGPLSDAIQRTLPRYTQEQLTKVIDELGRAHYWTPEGRPVCGRHRKAKNAEIEGEACLAPPMQNGVCRIHGGKAGAPIRHGRYSRVLKAWLPAFQRASSDKELLDAKHELALMDVAIEKLLERAEDLDTPSWREQLKRTYTELKSAIRAKRQGEVSALLTALGEQIEGGARADQIARDLVAQVDKRANRAQRAVELEIRKDEKVTASELAAVLGGFLDVLRRKLEPRTYFELLPALRKVAGGEGVPSAPPGDEDTVEAG